MAVRVFSCQKVKINACTYLNKLRSDTRAPFERLAPLTVEIKPGAGNFVGWCDGAQRTYLKGVAMVTLET